MPVIQVKSLSYFVTNYCQWMVLSLSLPVMHRTSLVSIVVHGRLLWAQPEALDKGAVEQAIKTIVDHDSDARDVHKTQG